MVTVRFNQRGAHLTGRGHLRDVYGVTGCPWRAGKPNPCVEVTGKNGKVGMGGTSE